MFGVAKQVRPRVFADADGCEFRSNYGVLECREIEVGEKAFARSNDGLTNAGWLDYLAEEHPKSVRAAAMALAYQMTPEQVHDDDVCLEDLV